LLSSSFPTVTAMRPKSSLVQNPYSVSKAMTADIAKALLALGHRDQRAINDSHLRVSFANTGSSPNALPCGHHRGFEGFAKPHASSRHRDKNCS
jgi:hypothetical protein